MYYNTVIIHLLLAAFKIYTPILYPKKYLLLLLFYLLILLEFELCFLLKNKNNVAFINH